MPSSIIDSTYYRDMFGTESMRKVFSDERRISAWLEAEVALARAEARVGVIPALAAEGIAKAARIENLDLVAMKAEFDRVGFPIMPLVHQLAKACDPETARWVHYGSTTQDILDTGMVIQMREGLELVEADLDRCIKALSRLAKEHRDTVMAGRTFQQQAAPITFGYKVAVWLEELLRHHERLPQLKKRLFVGQCAGAVGTFATLGEKGPAVRREMMIELGLSDPTITWHTSRDTWAETVFWLSMVGASLGKIATEVAMLMRTEVDEVREPYAPGRGASSTLPQKRNPIVCPAVIAIAHRLRECVGSQLTAMIQEHERAVGAMHIEWGVIPEAFILASAALSQTADILTDLGVNAGRMRANLESGGGFLMSEAVMMGLAPHIGRNRAHEIVYGAASKALDEGRSLREMLLASSEVMACVSEAAIDSLLDPANYTGSAGQMVDAVLARAEIVRAGK
jgi:3-carboxy-cis,cis-muconate cycloisomerase